MKKLIVSLFAVSALFAVVIFLTPKQQLFSLVVEAERRLAGLSQQQVTIGEFDLSYLKGGEGPVLLLLHGFGADKDNWNRMAMHLTSEFTVIAPDLPGFGESSKVHTADYDVDSQVARLRAFVTALEIPHLHIAGNSMGGYIAGNYAAKYPDSVNSLWLLNTLGISDAAPSEMFELVQSGDEPPILVSQKDDFDRLLSFVFHQPPFMPSVITDVLAEKAVENYPLHSNIFSQIHRLENQQVVFSKPIDLQLKQFEKPILISWGQFDRVLSVDGGIKLHGALPSSQLMVMPDVGHLPMLEAPRATARQWTEFYHRQSLAKTH